MQAILVPHGNAYMRRVESTLFCRYGNDVAIMNRSSEQAVVLYFPFGNLSEHLTGEVFLHKSYFINVLGIVFQSWIQVAVLAHEVNGKSLV